MQRIRIVYAKGRELMFTGNLDMQKVWERTFRRAGLELAYSQGFHPQPRIHQACPLPVGFTSQFELLDFWLNTNGTLQEIEAKLQPALQPGITILHMREVTLSENSLQTQVVAAKYVVFFDFKVNKQQVENRLNRLRSSEACIRTRRGKEYDLLPLIKSILFIDGPHPHLEMTLSATAGATGRPEEVLDELGIDYTDTSIVRTDLVLSE
ncbi:MAG TPA: TIGR03936 family radical SAM-associated protein [Anaerolineaceae bacterium]|nr:TIGR03936 family radical SAM-associated protein [Anaerolineaceae bacterium]